MKINQRLEFVPKAGAQPTVFENKVSTPLTPSERGQEKLAINLAVELEKGIAMSKHYNALPKIPPDLPKITSRTIRPERFIQDNYDLHNTQAVWMEISNTLIEAKYLSAEAHAYKDSEPPETAEDEWSRYRRHHAHFEKMYRLNLAVLDLVKVQDLIARLLFESFGGELIQVDRTKDDWERDITLSASKKGLKRQLDDGKLKAGEYDRIMRALTPTPRPADEKIAVAYRNEVAHRIRPSVDYAYLYAYLQDREGKELRDATGRVTGKQYSVFGSPSRPKYYFKELYPALVGHMKSTIGIVRKLKRIPRFR